MLALLPGTAQASRPHGENATTPAPSHASTPIWSDEFNGQAGLSPDSGKWQMATGLRCINNHELEFYTARTSNIALDGDGHLAITARRETYGSGQSQRSYTSGMIETSGLFATMYGSIQARIKIPAGRGLWPAFWALPANPTEAGPLYDEIDAMESLGQDPTTVYGTIHGATASGAPPAYSLGASIRSATSLAGGFHIYGVNWSPTSIQFTLDGVPYVTYTRDSLSSNQQWTFDQPFYLILNLAVGGDWPGAPDATTRFPATMLVDWVRVYPEPTPAPTSNHASGLLLAARSVSVKHGRACRVYFKVNALRSSAATVRVTIARRTGVAVMHWVLLCKPKFNGWLSRKYFCRLSKGVYRIDVSGRTVTGLRADVAGRARLRVT